MTSSKTSRGISRPNVEQLRLRLSEAAWERLGDSEEMTAGPSSHWTLSAATPPDAYTYPLQSPSVYSENSAGTTTSASYYPDARDDPRRFALLPPQPHMGGPFDGAASPPVLVLKLYRRKRSKEATKKIPDGLDSTTKDSAGKKIYNAAQLSTKAVGKLLHLPGRTPTHETPGPPPRRLRKLHRPPPAQLSGDQVYKEISAPFPSGNIAGFKPPSQSRPSTPSNSARPQKRSWRLPIISRANSYRHRGLDISAPFPIRDPPAGARRLILYDLSRRPDALPSRSPCYVNFSTAAGSTVSHQVRRTKSEHQPRDAPPLPGWRYCEYSPLLVEPPSSSLVNAMSTIVRGRDRPFPPPKASYF
ncbi:hypothetical protein B0H10DRAFT_1985856 [Mycena sp. CBHHK59/15]|nr:hypothetical protein B0H10DRAFT_1985856 [Mycena sp. CBHHK59/15]